MKHLLLTGLVASGTVTVGGSKPIVDDGTSFGGILENPMAFSQLGLLVQMVAELLAQPV